MQAHILQVVATKIEKLEPVISNTLVLFLTYIVREEVITSQTTELSHHSSKVFLFCSIILVA